LLVKAGQKVAEVMVETTGQRWSTPYKEMAVQALAERTLWQVLCNGRAA
jgi:hypothetical protein